MKLLTLGLLVVLVTAVFTYQKPVEQSAMLSWDKCVSQEETKIDALVFFKPTSEVRKEWRKTSGIDRLGHSQIKAFAKFRPEHLGKFVTIYIPLPEHTRDYDWLATFCHELRHGFEGRWHDNEGKEYHD